MSRLNLPLARRAKFGMVAALASLMSLVDTACAAQATVAVAANFAAPMQALSKAFEQRSGHKLVVAVGSTGRFHNQVRQGAPFDVLLAADALTPQALESEGHAVNGTRFVYAKGRLVLWTKLAGLGPALVRDGAAALKASNFERLAVADARLAPYGAAAQQSLQALGLAQALKPKLVFGESISQTHQFVDTGHAQLGFVALSQVAQARSSDGRMGGGWGWVLPQALHAPLLQEAVLLKHGQSNAAAVALLDFLKSAQAQALMASFGYEPG